MLDVHAPDYPRRSSGDTPERWPGDDSYSIVMIAGEIG
jgi:hypothetical protein